MQFSLKALLVVEIVTSLESNTVVFVPKSIVVLKINVASFNSIYFGLFSFVPA